MPVPAAPLVTATPGSTLLDHQWRLSYAAAGIHAGAAYTFGDLATSPVWTLSPVKIAAGEVRTADAEAPAEDGTVFGRDYRGGMTLTFEMAVDAAYSPDPRAAAAALLEQLADAWDAPAVRSVPRAVAALTGHTAGRDRRVYGRPRRFDVANDEFAEHGHRQVTADFVTVDQLWYDEIEQSITVPLIPPSTSGMLAPFVFPLSTTPVTAEAGAITVSGNRPAWPVITITAVSDALVNPSVVATNRWALTLAPFTLLPGRSVTIDPRPWARSVTTSQGASAAHALSADSPRLSKTAIPPGTQEFVLRGTDTSGTAQMQVRWRNAWTGR